MIEIEMWNCPICDKHFFVETKDREDLKICPYCEYHEIFPTFVFNTTL